MFKCIPDAIPKKIASTLLAMPPPGLLGRMGRTAVYTDKKKGTGRKKIKYQMEIVFARKPDFLKNNNLGHSHVVHQVPAWALPVTRDKMIKGKKEIPAVPEKKNIECRVRSLHPPD